MSSQCQVWKSAHTSPVVPTSSQLPLQLHLWREKESLTCSQPKPYTNSTKPQRREVCEVCVRGKRRERERLKPAHHYTPPYGYSHIHRRQHSARQSMYYTGPMCFGSRDDDRPSRTAQLSSVCVWVANIRYEPLGKKKRVRRPPAYLTHSPSSICFPSPFCYLRPAPRMANQLLSSRKHDQIINHPLH